MATPELTDLAREFAGTLSNHDAEALRAIVGFGYVNHNPYVARVVGPESAVAFFTEWLRVSRR